ncbi:GNAT family N-acetyltransferase [Mastigocoleus testarum]|uniref:N-acetyltransferase domain-containing protein n=1 Tax=Mastigocoleus testarum BC008 TaxID=371196 RepID=A0A0V7ZYZ6_9CYAN|nr:GNAT family N-acetyltransferase [Mastigocoleus testarum]KST69677.1 hypothetical protein BC008_05090 [Mastigocoleus testarum BC008]KST69698.1 hypothetical protein BC008_05190 [Mastigocoleus testarum BC008]
MTNTIKISTYNHQYQAQVIELILKIQQQELGLAITLEEQPDLLIIPSFYQKGNGNFWIALDGNNVIETIGAIDMGDNRYLALRKMFVDVNYRGKSRISKKLMDSLVSHARTNNVREIYLGTIGNFKGALRFYEKNGFLPVSKSDLPASFPVMEKDNLFYCLTVSTSAS